MPDGAQPILDVRDLKTVFRTRSGEVHAVNSVSFDLKPGELLGVVGESGSGKSVTMMSLIGLLPMPPAEIRGGVVKFGNQDLLRTDDATLRAIRGARIGFVFQDPMTSLNPVYQVGDQIGESIKLHQGLPEEKVNEEIISALRLLGIPAPEQRLHDFPFQMSGGMRQRVVGSIAMSCRPRLLIADEPTTALDATIQAQYIALFKDIQKQTDVAIIFITHDFGVVANICHRVAVMYAGKIVETASTSTIFKRPRHPYTVALIHSVPRLDQKDERLYSIEGQPPSLLNLPPACRFAPRCPDVMDICQKEQPPTIDIDEEHSVACWKEKK